MRSDTVLVQDAVTVGSVRVARRYNGNISIGSVHHSHVFDVERNDIPDLIEALELTQDKVPDASK